MRDSDTVSNEPLPLWRKVLRVFKEFLLNDSGTYSAAISYQMMLAFFPALLLLKSVQEMMGLSGSDVSFNPTLIGIEMPPQVLVMINDFLHSDHGISKDWRPYVDLAFIVLVIKALSHVFEEYGRAAYAMINRPYRMLRGMLVSGLLSCFVLLVCLCFFFLLNTHAAVEPFGSGQHIMLIFTSHVLLFTGLAVFFASLSKTLLSWQAILFAALVAMILWSASSYLVFQIDFDFAEEEQLYGQIAAFIVLLMWFFVTARVLLFSLACGLFLVDGEMN